MAVSDITFARFPLETDVNGIADTVPQAGLIGTVFPLATFTILHTELVQIGGDSGVFKNVLVVIAQQTS